MLERLYCPDFSTVLGEKFRDPFEFPMIDSLVWPTLKDIQLDKRGKNLLALMSKENHPLFYRRGVNINTLLTELKCSGLKGACLQAIDISKDFGISSEIVVKYCKNYDSFLFPILSPRCTKEGVEKFGKNAEKAVAIVIYPTYQKLDLLEPGEELKQILGICKDHDLPVKIDLGNMYLPDNHPTKISPAIIREFATQNKDLTFIISGIDLSGNGKQMVNLMRYERNLYIEIDPRTFGGTTPVNFYKMLFNIPGFIQYGWNRFLLGSSTPMLESSQVTRGFWNATESLIFAQQSLLRTMMYRNLHLIFKMPKNLSGFEYQDQLDQGIFDAASPGKSPHWENQKIIENSTPDPNTNPNEIFISQDLVMQSFSITQLLHVQPHLVKALDHLCEKYPDYRYGEFTIKSPHTTTSLLVNEHEIGNFLQLHYNLAEDTMAEASDKLHTTPALENRADFNYPDHITASSRGQRSITAPIIDGKPKIGGRENIYTMVTFGPRAIHLHLTVKLFKQK